MARGLLRSSSLRAQEQRRVLRKEWEPGKFGSEGVGRIVKRKNLTADLRG
jgi:hypothetical protein